MAVSNMPNSVVERGFEYGEAEPNRQTFEYNHSFDYTAEYADDLGYYDDDRHVEERPPQPPPYENRHSQVDYREKERDRDRSRRRDRDHRRDRNRRDRDRRDRDRDRGRDRDRSQEFEFGRDDRERDRMRERRESGEDGRDNHRDAGGEKWMTDIPTNTIILRGLPPLVEEKDIRTELALYSVPAKDVRLMKRSTGVSRGFAFVEFQTVAEAQRWMDQNQGKLDLMNLYTTSMHYSTPKNRQEKGPQGKLDWVCAKCGVHNFKRRDYCYKCNLSREESEWTKDDGVSQVGTNPCNTLIFQGLDALTTEDTLACGVYGASALTEIKNMKIIRDEITNTSRGYGFVELNSVMESTQLLETLNSLAPAFEVDGKQIIISFAKNTFSTVMQQLTAISSQQSQSWDYYYQGTELSGQPFDQSSYFVQNGQYYRANGQPYDLASYYAQQSTATTTIPTQSTQTDSTNAAAAVAQAAIQQAQAVKNFQKQVVEAKAAGDSSFEAHKTPVSQDASAKEYLTYPAPDVTKYQFDETSGYYYDPSTGLYYDASSQYYYNAQTGQFLYWNSEQSTYLPAPTQTSDQKDKPETGGKKDKEKKEKVKMAKKIAKDMEKWAKSQNAQKESLKTPFKSFNAMGQLMEKKESATADAGFAILEKTSKTSLEDKKLMPPPCLPSTSPSEAEKPDLVASYGGDSDEEEEEDQPMVARTVLDEAKLLDWTKMACLLCKRQFQNKEMLSKHVQLSDLHKENLETLKKSKGIGTEIENKIEYRDRAKERRLKYGAPEPPEPKRKRLPPPVAYEEPTIAGIGEDNIGNKLLQKMGWTEGKGLGKAGQGITAPIEAEKRAMTAGLGMRGSNYGTTAGDSYKDALKKTMYARYNEQE